MIRLRGTALALICVVLLSACSSRDPLVPEDVFQQVASVDRERNYDLAWQEIAVLGGQIERAELEKIASQAILVAARLERLETGQPGRLDDRDAYRLLEGFRAEAAERDSAQNLQRLKALGAATREQFDQGDFVSASRAVMEIYALALSIRP